MHGQCSLRRELTPSRIGLVGLVISRFGFPKLFLRPLALHFSLQSQELRALFFSCGNPSVRDGAGCNGRYKGNPNPINEEHVGAIFVNNFLMYETFG